jgi:hypothetical protein
MAVNVDVRELCKRVVKYVLEGLMVAFAALVLPQKSLKMEDVLGLALVAAATFAVLDMYAPNSAIAAGARQGAGFGLGANLVGFPARA